MWKAFEVETPASLLIEMGTRKLKQFGNGVTHRISSLSEPKRRKVSMLQVAVLGEGAGGGLGFSCDRQR
jgi:hypothetical protein